MKIPEITIEVESFYIKGNSDPRRNEYQFAYTITLTNRGKIGAQLLRRHWIIRDDSGRVEEVHGEGVVGQLPHLAPGESYQYTSGTLLQAPHGTMEGSYEWITDTQELFRSPIAPFYRSGPRVLH
jgi:ApaG protein